MARSNTKITGKTYGEHVYREGEVDSGATVYPGMVLEVDGTNSAGEPLVSPYSSDDASDVLLRVALTPESPPKANDSDVPREHEYSAGEHVQFQVFRKGDVVQNGLLADGGNLGTSGNASVSVGDTLVTYSDGSVRTGGTGGNGIAEASEAVNNADGSGTEGGISAKRLEYEVI